MPIYEYRCCRCSEMVEVMQKISDPPVKKCSFCGGKVKKQISNTTFVLKGTGWYATDYGKKDNGGARGEAGKRESKGEKKTAVKPPPDKHATHTE